MNHQKCPLSPANLEGGSVEIGDSIIGSHCPGISMLPQVLKVTPFYGTYLIQINYRQDLY